MISLVFISHSFKYFIVSVVSVFQTVSITICPFVFLFVYICVCVCVWVCGCCVCVCVAMCICLYGCACLLRCNVCVCVMGCVCGCVCVCLCCNHYHISYPFVLTRRKKHPDLTDVHTHEATLAKTQFRTHPSSFVSGQDKLIENVFFLSKTEKA